jgi:hypothetical protein
MDYQTAQFIDSQAPGPCLLRFVTHHCGGTVMTSVSMARIGVYPSMHALAAGLRELIRRRPPAAAAAGRRRRPTRFILILIG